VIAPHGHPKLVAAGLVADERGYILLSRRRSDQPLPGKWELPGGKIEPGEAPEEALRRELEEELGAAVEVGPIWDVLYHRYPDQAVLMLVYACRFLPGERPRCVEVAAIEWVPPDDPDDGGSREVLPADRPLLDRLRREGPPRFSPTCSPSPSPHLTGSRKSP